MSNSDSQQQQEKGMVRKAGEWVADDIRREGGYMIRSRWMRFRYTLLSWVVDFLPPGPWRSMARRALSQIVSATERGARESMGRRNG